MRFRGEGLSLCLSLLFAEDELEYQKEDNHRDNEEKPDGADDHELAERILDAFELDRIDDTEDTDCGSIIPFN